MVLQLREGVLRDADARTVREASANYGSGAGLYFHLPHEVAVMVEAAFEIGYAQALQDVRDQSVDGLGLLDVD